MIKTKIAVIAALAVFSTLLCQARTFTVKAWRGETVAALVEDFAIPDMELHNLPRGVKGRIGTLREVRYMTAPKSLQYTYCADRVEWNSAAAGPRVVELEIAADVAPGKYLVGAMELDIVDRVLPQAKDWKFYLDLWQHPWSVSRVTGTVPFSREHYAAMRPVWELLASAGQKSLTVSILEQPWNHQCFDPYHSMIHRKKNADGTWLYDYSLFDEYVQFGRNCGIGPDIACYTMCPWGYMVGYYDHNGNYVSYEAKPNTKEFDEFWGPFLEDFAKHLKAKGWFKDTLVAMDERAPDDVLYIANFIQKHAPGMRIAMAGNRKPSDFKGITIDVYSQVLFHVTDEFLAECADRRAKGFVTTHYVCCSPRYPNTFMDSRAGEAFWNGAAPAFLGLDGFLRWAYNSWGENAMSDASYGSWRAGDTFLVYPDGSPSWRFLELRNGVVAAEKARILKSQGLFAEEFDKIKALYDVQKAVKNKCDFIGIRKKTLELVNR
jgi:hypothetical protein